MLIKGKYNDAKVYTDNIDNETVSQVIKLCSQQALADSVIKIMPDCHAGKGCVVGTTMTIVDKIIPNLVGVDIGCGMSIFKLSEKIDFQKIDDIIKKYIPHGYNVHSRSREKLLKNVFKLDLSNLKAKADLQRAYKSVGTLGGGNHFIEIDISKNNDLHLIVHTGSRSLGKEIAEYYQSKAIKYCKEKYENSTLKKPENDLCYLEGDLMEDYLNDMNLCQQFAMANRISIISDILYHYYDTQTDFLYHCNSIKKSIVECIHNYIDIQNKILRKGAISAQIDENVIIPINMRDGIIIGVGKGNKNWNFSAPHGAGRILSRGQAKNTLSLENFQKSMDGIFTTSVSQKTLDEAPQAYKPIEDILMFIDETINISEILKPVYNFKSN